MLLSQKVINTRDSEVGQARVEALQQWNNRRRRWNGRHQCLALEIIE